ncbi:MAG TPA: hypothetical protein IAA57_08075 [Candidatus Pullilachnospira intestinigallinarum]|nr:hypothetical protein [Clostridium sp.]HIS26831.1 hypothetical protein [Candidatus Pullilachnospira intestinigallinarum]
MNGDYSLILKDCRIELENIQRWITANPMDSNVRYLTSYAVIKASGTIENVLKRIIFDTLSDGAKDETKNYLTKSIMDASYNPSPGQIYKLLEKINTDWKQQFESFIRGSNQKGELKSLVELRNSFAHGSSITASIRDVVNYFNAGVWILERLCDVVERVE